eukprot:PITA_01767
MEEYINYFLNHGAGSTPPLQNGIKKFATLEEKDEDFLMMMQQTQQLDNNLLLVSPPLSQLDEGCFVCSVTPDRPGEGLASNVEPRLSIDLTSQMQQQEEEINTLIKTQNEKVIKWVLEMRQRHLQEIFAGVEQRIFMILKEKDADLENLRHRNFQLQALTKQLSMDALMWQKVAKDNEVMVGKLRSDLEQLVAQIRDQQISRERCDDGDDALSCSCYPQDHSTLYKYHGNGNGKGKFTMKEAEEKNCKVCRMKSSCIVLLPCRHVCVCADCEMEVIACPLCNAWKSASIQAHMS